jgi:hypothetical protein
MICKICNSQTTYSFCGKVINKYTAEYFRCHRCDFLQVKDPFWLKEAYDRPINLSDTGILQRNLTLCRKASVLAYFLFDKSGKYLDYGGGYGIFTRLMRDVGFDFYWLDPYTENIFAFGFEYMQGNKKLEMVTSFESFEHFEDPCHEIENILSLSETLLFSTQLLPEPVKVPGTWWYYGLEHGQHIGFYSLKTLGTIAKKYNMNLYSDEKSMHMFSSKTFKENYFKKLLRNSEKYFKLVKKHMRSKTVEDMNRFLTDAIKGHHENTL